MRVFCFHDEKGVAMRHLAGGVEVKYGDVCNKYSKFEI